MTKSLPFDAATRLRKAAEHLAIEVDGEVMLMSESQGRYFGLDAIASDIWRRLDQPRTLVEMCAALAADYTAAPGVIEGDVAALLKTLFESGLVQAEP